MPRGNLEAIVPRPLALHLINRGLLPEKKYYEAFQICRRNRLDFNTLITPDFDPDMLIDQLSHRPDFLNLFITSLADLAMCEKIRHILQSRYQSLIEPILTAFAREARWCEALQCVKSTPALIKYLLYLAPTKTTLYGAALESLDLDCAFAVAQQSQMDPQEYRPFLTGLKEMTPEKAKFTVLDHIGKHKEALALLFTVDPC